MKATTGTPISPEKVSTIQSMRERGVAVVLAHPDPDKVYSRLDPIEVEAGTTVAEALRRLDLIASCPSYAGIIVRRNGATVPPGEFETLALEAGDRVIARVMPREPISITAMLTSIATGISAAGSAVAGFGAGFVTGLASGLTGGGLITGATAGYGVSLGAGFGAGAFVGSGIGVAGLYAGASYVLSLATRALVGSPSGGSSKAATKRTSPTAAGTGNQILPGHPVYVPCGDVRVFPPHVAVPFQPGVVGGQDQDPSLRELLGVAGDVIIDEGRFGKTALELLDIEYTIFRNQTTVNFPTAAVKRPGMTLRDIFHTSTDYAEQTINRFEVISTDDECDEIALVWFLPAGLARIDSDGERDEWQVSFDLEYRVAGSGSWTGFFAADGAGNSARWRAPFVIVNQSLGNNRIHLTGKTSEPFFFYVQRKVQREHYEVRFRLRHLDNLLRADGTFHNGQQIRQARWPKDRWPDPDETKGKTNTSALQSDPQLVQFTAFRDEPAIDGFGPGLSGIDLTLNDQTTKSDESSRISFRCRRQIPELSGGARTAPTTTSNPIAIVLDLMTGPLIGTVAVEDDRIDFPSFQYAFDKCNTLVKKPGGGTEPLHRCDFVLDAANGAETLWQEILSSFRMKLIKLDGKYHIVVDEARTSPRNTFGETEILDMESDRSWTIPVDALSVEFFNGEKDGDLDEMVVYADSPPVAGKLPNGGYAEKTATIASASTTITRSGDYATLTISGGPTWASFPEKGWLCVRYPTVGAAPRMFLIDSVSSNLLSMTVIDAGVQLSAGSGTGKYDTTKALRIDTLRLPYQQRPSEIWREAYYRLAQRNRPEIHKVDLGLEILSVEPGSMIELSSKVPQWGRGSGRVLSHDGLITAVTDIEFGEEFNLSGLSSPAIKLVTVSGGSVLTTRIDVDASATATLRTLKGSNRWLAFDGAHDLDALNAVAGGGKGSTGHFGELGEETREVIVQAIRFEMDENGAIFGSALCLDHAPEIFTSIIDQAPVPRFQSGITEPGIGDHAKPARPEISVSADGPSTGMGTINAAAPSGGNQAFTRTAGSFIADGWTAAHKASFEGFTTSGGANNHVRRALSAAPTATVLSVVGTSGVSEAGNGDERVRGVLGTIVQTLSIRRAATGITKLTVTSAGAGTWNVDAPAGQSRFAGFEGIGIVQLSDMPSAANSGWFVVQSKPSDDRLVLSSTTMEASTGLGSERCHVASFRRATGNFISDGIQVGHRIEAAGFAQSLAGVAFTVRAVGSVSVAVEDPFGLLVTETGSGDETLTVVRVPLAYEVDTTVGTDSLGLSITVPIRPGAKGVVPTEELETRYRLRDRATGRITGGWISEESIPASSAAATFGPVPLGSDFDFAMRAISRGKKTASDWNVLTGNGPSERPPAPTLLQVHGDSVVTDEGSEFALRVEWA